MVAMQTFIEHLAPFTRVVEGIRDWDAPSPCEGWTAHDVLDHVIDTQREFLARHTTELPRRTTGEPRQVWADHRTQIEALLADPDLATTEFEGYFGTTSVGATLDRFYGFDLIVHRWDIAAASGVREQLSDAELDELEEAAEGFGPALRADGVCKDAVPVPEDAPRQDRVLAYLGRNPGSDGRAS